MQYLISSCLNFLKNDNKFHLILGSQMIGPQFLSLYSPISNLQYPSPKAYNYIKEWDLAIWEKAVVCGETHQAEAVRLGSWGRADGRCACRRRRVASFLLCWTAGQRWRATARRGGARTPNWDVGGMGN